ncbi:MAG: hypothetical protein JSS02_22755 [Planctomycetes bacterium]|nr:hypothetical protein [Planctomycetota bacterium]
MPSGTARPESREAKAQREIGHTEMSAGVAWFLLVAFGLTLAAPPLIQLARELRDPQRSGPPSALALASDWPRVVQTYQHTSGQTADRLLAANRVLLQSLTAYERQLADRSWLNQTTLGPTQQVLSHWTGLGNEQVYVGTAHWLYYRPDVDYLTGPGFLHPAILERRTRAGGTTGPLIAPDPRPAILQFQQDLARRGISLIVVPTPNKAALSPQYLSPQAALSSRSHASVLTNASYAAFIRDLQAAGVQVFDPAPLLASQQTETDTSPCLRTDSHWNPAAVQTVAAGLADVIRQARLLPDRPPLSLTRRTTSITNLGDTAALLHLPEAGQHPFRETVDITQILDRDQKTVTSDAAADVLLLGDSYTNIYSLPELRWGTSAGFAEHLLAELQRPLDWLAQNDGGASGTRHSLVRELAAGSPRLAKKRLVIWQFAVRDLAGGDWRVIPLPNPTDSTDAEPPGPTVAASTLVQATIRAAAGAPVPGSVPYREALTSLHLVNVTDQGQPFAHPEIVVYLWGLRDNRVTPAGRLINGQPVSLRLVPWETVRTQYERFNRLELDDPEFQLIELPLYWGELVD